MAVTQACVDPVANSITLLKAMLSSARFEKAAFSPRTRGACSRSPERKPAGHSRRSMNMAWTIERKHDHVAVVTMNTNKVNVQNPAFFDDLHAAFDRLDSEFDECAVVLTGTGRVFSAGLDLDRHFAMFARRD